MVKIYVDPGHGGHDPGAAANGLREKDLVLKIGKDVAERLKSSGFDVKMSRTGDSYPSLSDRTNEANRWGADLFLSIHINAGGGDGYENFRYSGVSAGSKTGKIQATIHKHMKAKVAKFGMDDRGIKSANFHVLRETSMPAVLEEIGFIDSKADASDLANGSFRSQAAWGIVDGICEVFGKKPKAPGSGSGSSSSNDNKLVIVKDNSDGWLWTYGSANWNDHAEKVHPGEAFTIVDTLTVKGSKMYKIKSGLYITASDKYVYVK